MGLTGRATDIEVASSAAIRTMMDRLIKVSTKRHVGLNSAFGSSESADEMFSTGNVDCSFLGSGDEDLVDAVLDMVLFGGCTRV